jgi:hypothetical protein
MPDLDIFSWKDMTGVVQRFVFPQFWFVNNIPTEDVEGTLVQWDIEKQVIAVDTTFTTDAGTAHPARQNDIGKQSYEMPVSFVYTVINSGDVTKLRRLGAEQRDAGAEQTIMRHLTSLRRRYTDFLTEWMISRAFTGTMSVTIGDASGTAQTIDFGLPSSHITTAAASWSTAGTNILSDIRTQKVLIAQDYGAEAAVAVHNATVSVQTMRNTDLGNLVQGSVYASQIAEAGRLTNFFGLRWVEINHRFSVSGQTEGFMTPFVADERVIFIPEPDSNWMALQVGTVSFPDVGSSLVMGAPRFNEARGPVIWSEMSSSPTGLKMYLKHGRGVAVRNPTAWTYFDTTP